MSLVDKIKTIIAPVILATAVGCSSPNKKTEYPQWMLPVNVVAGYFGSIATHEGGHALAAKIAGGKKIKVDVIPVRKQGVQYLGYTEARGTKFSDAERTWFNVSGPMSQYCADVATRELLKTGYVPNVAQPTLQWYSLWDKLSVYTEAVAGLRQKKHADLGKENVNMAIGFLGAQLAYDLYEGFTDKGPFFEVLAGEKFYETPTKTTLSMEADGDSIGLFVSKEF